MYSKQILVSLALVAMLSACTAEKTDGAPSPSAQAAAAPDMHNSQNSLDWAGTYEGLLPCADCAGVKTRLTLDNEGVFQLQSQRLEQVAEAVNASGHFSWLPDGSGIGLGDIADDRLFAVGEGRLIELNSDGSQPESDPATRTLRKLSGGQTASDAVTAAFLQDHRWLLESAKTGANQRIDAVFPKDRPFQFSFAGTNMAVSGGCNGLRGSYQINAEGRFVAGRMISTMMACEPALMAADTALSALLAQPLRMMLVQGPQPTLILLSPGNDVLMLSGRKTPEAMYGPATQVFLEVAAQTVACQNPPAGQSQCLQVREISFDEKGLRAGSPGEWTPFTGSIEGYQHSAGVRNVLRLNRYQPADNGAVAVYVLDMVVESETVQQ
jgi:heat shock protein HslJ/uncharacterized lipoprotein NlpE involved in copper resistance